MKKILFILFMTFILVLYSYFNAPGLYQTWLPSQPLIRELPGDLPAYAARFILSFFLFGLLPLVLVLSGRGNRTQLGLVCPREKPLRRPLYLTAIFISLSVGIFSGFNSDLAAFYPYSKTLVNLTIERSWSFFVLHIFSYSLLYYLPWEIFFRGFMILPLLPEDSGDNGQVNSRLMMIASIQVIPSSLIHFGHPISETLGAIPFGLFCGYLVIRYRSILPGLFLHIITGGIMDLTIILRTS